MKTKVTTKFATIYNRFLGKITDDMYVELTPQDTLRDLQSLLIDALPCFEFPRCDLFDYTITTVVKNRDEITSEDFVLGIIWHELENQFDSLDDMVAADPPVDQVLVEESVFNFELSSEEINIIAILMMSAWVQRQVTSIENTRMKYSGSDFKMTSQANHLQKLLSLLSDCQRQSLHMQRLYKRRRFVDPEKNKNYRSNWDMFGYGVNYDRTNGY